MSFDLSYFWRNYGVIPSLISSLYKLWFVNCCPYCDDDLNKSIEVLMLKISSLAGFFSLIIHCRDMKGPENLHPSKELKVSLPIIFIGFCSWFCIQIKLCDIYRDARGKTTFTWFLMLILHWVCRKRLTVISAFCFKSENVKNIGKERLLCWKLCSFLFNTNLVDYFYVSARR